MTTSDRSLTDEEIDKRFGAAEPTVETLPLHEYIRNNYKIFVSALDTILPEGRAKSLALTELESSAMWANKAVAQLGNPIQD